MKKVLIIILTLCILTALCSCGEKPEPKPVNAGSIEEGEYLYKILSRDVTTDKPAAYHIHIDHGGPYDEAYVDDDETLAKLTELFTKIKIGSFTPVEVTDNYNSVSIIWADETEMYISLNLKNLEIYENETCYHYELEDFDEFWKMINELAEPVNE